ncbi:uncharacterized protein LOC130768842 [Actinidia eriantha]|uniref:uncharacterized protein LOC130768842 n=1 Tax=Actinidia eriantha TaxID=165200 RepID=UPI00258A334C|nr:uncharacterized protein LOC130768842 [Actinidia eriantha]
MASGQGALVSAFNVVERDVADKEAARMFYASGLPFNFARLAGYVPPSFDRLRTTLLAQEKEHINRQRRLLINVMADSSGRAMFLKAIDASGNIKDAEYVANLFIQVFKDSGEANVVQIVMDNASNYKATGLGIEGKYPYIFWTPCVVHSLNLALKSIYEPREKSLQYAQCKWVSDLVNQVIDIRNFILNHGMANHIFNQYTSLKLLSVAEMRFASSFIMAKRQVKSSIEKMVMDSNWKIYREDGNTVAETKTREVTDTDAPVLHLVYDMWDSMIENVKKRIFEHEGKDMAIGRSSFFDAIHQILEGRWNKSNTPLHCMAHSLVPKYYCDTWLNDGGGNGVTWVAPHEDHEVSINRSKCFQCLFPNQTDLRKVYTEYGAFSNGFEYFGQPHVIDARILKEPISWWANHGASTPLLQALAFKLLSQPASSCCAKRNWSTYSVIQSIKRNRLTPSRSEDLVFVHCNLRLLSWKSKEYTDGPTKFRDISGDQFDIEGQEVGELAQLSLDEPKLERMTFQDAEGERTDIGTGWH